MPSPSYGLWPVPSTHSFPVERKCWRSQRLMSSAYDVFEIIFKVQIWNSLPGLQLSHGNVSCLLFRGCRWQLKYHPLGLLLRFKLMCFISPSLKVNRVVRAVLCASDDLLSLWEMQLLPWLLLLDVSTWFHQYLSQNPLDLDFRKRHQLLEMKEVIQSWETTSSPLQAQFEEVQAQHSNFPWAAKEPTEMSDKDRPGR